MENQFHFGTVVVPPDLQDAMWTAHEKIAEKQSHVERLRAGKRDIEAEIAAAHRALDEAKKSHINGFAEIAQGATSLPDTAKKAKAKIAEIGGPFPQQGKNPDRFLAFWGSFSADRARMKSRYSVSGMKPQSGVIVCRLPASRCPRRPFPMMGLALSISTS